jgi:hypothetical protein
MDRIPLAMAGIAEAAAAQALLVGYLILLGAAVLMLVSCTLRSVSLALFAVVGCLETLTKPKRRGRHRREEGESRSH